MRSSTSTVQHHPVAQALPRCLAGKPGRSRLQVCNSLWAPRQSSNRAQATASTSVEVHRPQSQDLNKPQQAAAPPTTPPSSKSSSITELQTAVTDFASQLVSALPSWPSTEQQAGVQASPQGVAEETSSAVNIEDCLQSVPIWELKHIRKLCHLTSLTYKMPRVTPRAMRRRHQLTLVTTSWACEIRLYEHSKSADEVMEEGDGMAVSVSDAKSTYHSLTGRNSAQDSAANGSTDSQAQLSNIVPLSLDTGSSRPAMGSPTPPYQAQAGDGVTSAGELQQQAGKISGPSNSGPSNGQGPAQQVPRWASPAQMVAGMVLEAASAAASAASPLASAAVTPIASAASSLYAGLASLPIASALGANPLSSAPSAAAAIMSAAAAAVRAAGVGSPSAPSPTQLAVGLAAAAGPAAIAAAPASTSMRLAAPVQSTTGSPACPSEWFVCDHESTCTRYFVIQGSDTVDHWKLNLTFEPVTFEDPALGIKVHKGAYEAAQILYERFLPMVYEHLDSSPFAKICFTGHSIGGSLGVLLALMYYHRGVLPAANLATVYTFGSPAVFCMDPEPPSHHSHHTPASSHSQQHRRHHHQPAAAAQHHHHGKQHELHQPRHHLAHQRSKQQMATNSSNSGTAALAEVSKAAAVPPCRCGSGEGSSPLAALGLPEHTIRNVIMPRDIVPKSFACDYALVSDILQTWGPSFKAHPGLANARRHLYYFTGRVMVLQPDSRWHWFAQPEPDHPMLPPGADMWVVGPPRDPTAAASGARLSQQAPAVSSPAAAAAGGATVLAANITTSTNGSATATTFATGATAATNDGSSSSSLVAAPAAASSVALRGPVAVRRPAQNEADALWSLMDSPHPLEMLTDPGAYLDRGSISRYHNPDNYTAALGRLIFLKRKQEGKIPSWQWHSYSRSLMMEAAEMQEEAERRGADGSGGQVLLAGLDDIAPWDSSDGDAVLPIVVPEARPLPLADALPW